MQNKKDNMAGKVSSATILECNNNTIKYDHNNTIIQLKEKTYSTYQTLA